MPIESDIEIDMLFIFNSLPQNESNAQSFAEQMEHIFSVHEHQLVTISSNISDGIGDYASHVYFIEKLTHLTADYKNIPYTNEF